MGGEVNIPRRAVGKVMWKTFNLIKRSATKGEIMDRMLTIGSTGSDVGELQALLNQRPPTQVPLLTIDNIFGPKTSARVKEFQRNNGLQVDGSVGPKTWTKLRALQPP